MNAYARSRATLVAGLLLFAACNNTPVTIAPPRIPQGGRALSIAVAGNDPRHMAVTSETGGLFRTYNGGSSWQHLDGLPNHMTVDVAIAWTNPDIMIATTAPQYHAVNDGGIWRSTDGGGTWSQPTGWAPPPGPGCPSRPGAFGISHMPLSTTFYVGTDCGIAVSNDNGVHWTNVVLDPAATSAADSLQNRVRSVLVINRSAGVAAADRGLFHIAGGTWVKSQDVQTSGQVPVIHAFASPWWSGTNPPVFYHASGGQMLWVSSDGGATWTQVAAPSVNNREAFVRVGRPVVGDDRDGFELWYGDGAKLRHQDIAFGALTGTNDWKETSSDHLDPSDIAFDLDHQVPTLLATDGGVHITPDSGATWKLTGSAYGGYVALQINEIVGQAVTGSAPHLDLYFSTQDNDLKASPNGGQNWDPHICCEGHFLRIAPTSVDHKGARFTGAACGACFIQMTAEHFTNVAAWPNAPDGNHDSKADSPFLLSGDSYLQIVVPANAMPPTFDFFLTSNAGGAWTKSYSLSQAPKGPVIIAGAASNPIAYQAVRASGALPNGGPRYGIVRVSNPTTQGVVSRADSLGFGALGALHTPQGTYGVLGADPTTPSHLIAADVEQGHMSSSANGGTTWQPMNGLTQAVTDSGRYLFALHELALPTVVAWDPYDGCHILVGTVQNGIMRSTDGGNTWAQIPGSKYATYVSSIYFPPTGAVWVATNGRGLWTMNLDRHPNGPAAGRCRFPGSRVIVFPVDTLFAIDAHTGAQIPITSPKDSAICASCTIVLVRNGYVTGIDRSNDAVTQVAISGGTISQIDRSGRELPLAIANVYRAGNGQLGGKLPRASFVGQRRVRGLVLDGTRLVKLLASEREVPFAPARAATVFVQRAGKGDGQSIVAGDSVRVMGTGFVPPARGGAPARILFDGQPVAATVPVDASGSFSVVIQVRRPPGELVVTAEQRDGRRTNRESASITVMGDDREETSSPTR
jgi:photosystem II stability/assembly factor-like uncharacterized protein